ncbi:MAG TPA: hypothetical protein DCZ43_11500, partial [candidate division Zixibacteria bacterium]|nr:hypothetical protein [candidate division Zixibacteria bacterium]
MKVKLQTAVVVLIVLLGATGTLWASQAVRVVSDLEGTTPGFSVSRAGSSGERLELSVPAIAINPISLNGNEYKQVGLPATDYLLQSEAGQDGEPDVPSLTSMLIIPDQAGIQLDISYSSYDIIDNIDLAPVQPSPSDTDPNAVIPFTMNESIYQTDAFYPEQLASAADPIIMRDVRAVQIQINPVQYNPVRHQLRVYRDLTVNVNYAGEVVNPKLTGTSYLSDGFYPLYKSTFANFEEFFSNTEIKRGGYMIICKPTLADSLKAVAAWKHQKGYTVRIVKTTDIIPSGSPNYTQVFNYIKTAYQTWTVPPEYVMIVGDIDGTFGIPCYTYQSYPSDHHYACVDGTDFIPDIFVARLSVDAIADFRKAVSKIFKYEKTPLMRDTQHWIRGLAVGYTMFPTARYTTLWARQLAMRHGFARVDTIYGSSDNPNLNTYMNNGPGLIWYRGEGNQDGWWGVSYDIADLNAMPNNQKLGVMSPLTCGLGDFSANDCFGETWIRMGLSVDSLKGGPAFYGVTDHFTHTKWNNPIMTGYFFGMFEQNCYHFGQAAIAGKMQDYRTFPRNLNSEVQQYFNTYNMQGDPELEIRQAVPVLINVVHPDTLGFGLNHIEISVADTMGQAIKDAIVTLVKSIDSTEEVFSVGQTDENGNVSLSFRALTTGSMILTVSGRDLYPYQSLVEIVSSDIAVGYDSLYIDDDSIGFSRGNSDGFAGPAEIIELGVAVRNFGDSLAADSIIGVLTPIDEGVVDVFDGTRYYNDLAPGESRMDSRP